MSKIELIVNSLDEKVQKVLYELAELKNDNTTLKQELHDANALNSKLLHTLHKKRVITTRLNLQTQSLAVTKVKERLSLK